MEYLSAIFLGALQGLTEFFPVSSSGHLVIAQSLIPGFNQPGVLFDVILHFGTLMAVLLYYRRVILKLGKDYYTFVIIGTIPAALVGLILGDFIEGLFDSTKVVGFMLLATALVNYLTDTMIVKEKKMNSKTSLFVGIFQAIAIIPGISRSGSTIFAGHKRGLDPQSAAQFSFLLSIPAIVGATFLQLTKYSGEAEIDFLYYILGFMSAFLAGYFAIGWVLKLLEKKKFRLFSYYCLVVGIFVIFFL